MYSLQESNKMCKCIGDKKNVKNAYSKADANGENKACKAQPLS